jgi:hypothetical protein
LVGRRDLLPLSGSGWRRFPVTFTRTSSTRRPDFHRRVSSAMTVAATISEARVFERSISIVSRPG